MLSFFFLGAAIILATSSWGLLSVPGLLFAVAGIIFSLRKQTGYAAICGYVPAVGSFIGQSVVGICISCTLAACLFATAAVIASIILLKEKPGRVALGVVALVVSMGIFIFQIPEYHVMANATPASVSSVRKEHKDKLLYYFSPSCKFCESTLKLLCEYDPEGKYWAPVVAPQIEAYGGEKMLRKHGYKGEFETSWESPSGRFPCLVIGEQIFSGSQKTTEEVKAYFASRET